MLLQQLLNGRIDFPMMDNRAVCQRHQLDVAGHLLTAAVSYMYC
jgi:hypothetical protein